MDGKILSDDDGMIQLYPIENLFPILDENDQLPAPNNILQTPKSAHARPLSLYEWNEIQAAYIWVQTSLKTTRLAYFPLRVSYSELWWILQCFLEMVIRVQMVQHVDPSACQQHEDLFNKNARARKLQDSFNWRELTCHSVAHARMRTLMELLERCSNGSETIVITPKP